MAITTTVGALIQAEGALTRLMARDWPLPMTFRLTRLARAVRAETMMFESLRQTLVRKYGTEPDAEGTLRVRPECLAEFSRQVNETAAASVTIEAAPLTAAQILAAMPEMRLAPRELIELGPLFDDGDTPD